MPVDTALAEEEIVALLKEHDTRGLRYAYDRYAAALYGAVYRIVPLPEVAEEILQEAFIKIWQHINTYNVAKGLLYTWMLSIARELAKDKMRNTEIKEAAQNQNVNFYVTANEPAKEDGEETARPLQIGMHEITATLRREQKELIDLIYFYGFTLAEAGSKLKMPLGTVKTRVRSAFMELRKLFQQA